MEKEKKKVINLDEVKVEVKHLNPIIYADGTTNRKEFPKKE